MNLAAQHKTALRESYYVIQTQTKPGYSKQHVYQLYPKILKQLLEKTGSEHLKIIPIGDGEVAGDYWVIPYEDLKDLLVPENVAKGLSRRTSPRQQRWRFKIENQLFVLYPGQHRQLGEINVSQYRGVELPPINCQKSG